MNATIEIDGLCKRFGPVQAQDGAGTCSASGWFSGYLRCVIRAGGGLGDVGPVGVLGEVAPRPGFEGVDDRGVVGVGGKDHDSDLWVMPAELAGGLDPVQDRHPQIEQDRVRAGLPDDVQGFLPVGRRADDLDAVG